jgi:hypothetical protein
MIDTKNPSVEFTALDRCDRCGSRAYSSFRKDGLELLFCLHHAHEHNLSLECSGWEPYYDFDAIEQLVEPVPA